jgi:hypothetical protein
MKAKYIFIIYNIFIIIFFTFIYYLLSDKHFHIENDLIENNKITIIDCFNLSVTIQSTVGLPSIKAKTKFARMIITIQQLLLLVALYTIFIEIA